MTAPVRFTFCPVGFALVMRATSLDILLRNPAFASAIVRATKDISLAMRK